MFVQDKWVTSQVVEHKGADEWAAKVATHDILSTGLKEFVYKSDGERSMVALKHEVARKLKRDAGPIWVPFEESGVGESQGNAVVEVAIWEIESMTRTLVHATQEFHDAKLELTHLVRVFCGRELGTAHKSCSAVGERQQDSVRATQGSSIQEKTSAFCGSSDVSPCGGEKSWTTV